MGTGKKDARADSALSKDENEFVDSMGVEELRAFIKGYLLAGSRAAENSSCGCGQGGHGIEHECGCGSHSDSGCGHCHD